ncbi:UDP-glucose 4-epimerase [Salinivirga cyanobacteriivorans]|uniref:UDP-glucose 4-epimerase n=1 Tax=Salinivirga cyanobacteriivorans TaxID=1307839 RepID=A0A0S2I4D1_9BACT|nr:aldehyde reductase [Salinivirga cyanobacteriivorans]ALO17168.1 UDP-glucose 4-epimerase [Salinivirga cyanobacteriivorans]
MAEEKKHTIVVTGATGYVASWVVKNLLDSGHNVRATVRDKSNKSKYDHLTNIAENNKGQLEIFEADLLKPGSFDEVVHDADMVIHMASPFKISGIKNAQRDLIEPAVVGTRNVLESVNKAKSVKRVVLTSSVVAIYGDAIDIEQTPEQVFNETIWNETSTENHQPYALSKTLAEKAAWGIYDAQKNWSLVVINPGFVLGPSLSKRKDSTSIDFMRSLLNGKYKSGVPDLYFGIVDVRNVAQAHVNGALKSEASGRHILVSDTLRALQIAKKLKQAFPDNQKIPKKVLPNFLLYLLGPLQGFTWKFLRRNLGIKLRFDNNYSIKDLDIDYIKPDDTLREHGKQLYDDGLL